MEVLGQPGQAAGQMGVGNLGEAKFRHAIFLRRLTSERFRAKWVPVRVKKTRQNKKLEYGSDFVRTVL
jgi:hypothetical protein